MLVEGNVAPGFLHASTTHHASGWSYAAHAPSHTGGRRRSTSASFVGRVADAPCHVSDAECIRYGARTRYQ